MSSMLLWHAGGEMEDGNELAREMENNNGD